MHFMKLGRAQARAFGVPDLPLVEVPHPIGGLALDNVRGRADIVVPQLLRLIEDQLK